MRRIGQTWPLSAACCCEIITTSTLPSIASLTRKTRREAWARLIRRRNRAVRLIEEMNLRTNRLEPLFAKLQDIAARMRTLRAQIKVAKVSGYADGHSVSQLQDELRY